MLGTGTVVASVSPTRSPRSPYWLQRPWTSRFPLSAMSSVLPWLASHSISRASLDVDDPRKSMEGIVESSGNGETPRRISTCGYGPSAIACLLTVGSVMV